jgi:hypothetical protein
MRRTLALCGCAVVLLAACGGDDAPDERRFEQDGAPFAFAYPPDLIAIQPQLRETESSPPTFKTSVGTDEANYVHVATYDTKVPVDLANPENQNAVDRAAQFLAKNTGWELGARQQAKLGPLDAFVYPLEKVDAGREGRLIYAFSGPVEYFVRCEWEYDVSPQIPVACDQVQRTFEPLAAAADTGGSSSQPATTTAPASSSGG